MREAGVSTFVNVAAGQTDSPIVAAKTDARIEVLAFFINHGDTTASSVTFNSKGSGAGTAISPLLKYPANGGGNFGDAGSAGWFRTNKGEGLTVTTSAGSTTAIGVIYRLI